MVYMNRWGAPPPPPKPVAQKVIYTEKKEFDNFADNVRHDLVKIINFINNEIEPEVNRMHADLDGAMDKTDVLARYICELQHDVRELREKEMSATVVKRRRVVTVRADGKEVRIERV